jgi:indolepyruvate ferredoxin oxidoreductase alpha subunit
MKKILLGNEAIVQGALEAGVDFVSTYPGTPASEIGNTFSEIAKENGVYFEFSTNEKVALEAAIGASFSGLKCLVAMKSFGMNVASDSLLPLCYTGTKGPMVIVVADDPSCWSSAQSEENSRAFAYLAHIPIIEPSDPQEAKDFTKFAFEISEKFNLPVILRTTTRVAHQRMPVTIERIENKGQRTKGSFIKDTEHFVTMPPRVLEMKKELLEKIEKIRELAEKSKINQATSSKLQASKIGIITSGVSYLYIEEAFKKLKINLPVLKLGFFYPLPEEKIKKFIRGLKKVLIIEELEPYLEKEVARLARESNCKLEILGKNVLPQIEELRTEIIIPAIGRLINKKLSSRITTQSITAGKIPIRTPRFCLGCPHTLLLSVLKRLASKGAIFGGDIGCYMMAGYPPFSLQDYLFSMGSSMGIGHGIEKSSGQKVITFIGDSTFFHSGIPALINAVFNKSNLLVFVLDNRITAMTGHQPNPGMGKTGMGEDSPEIKIEDIARACGVKNVKVVDPINVSELEATIKEYMDKKEISLIVSRRICALLAKKQKNG